MSCVVGRLRFIGCCRGVGELDPSEFDLRMKWRRRGVGRGHGLDSFDVFCFSVVVYLMIILSLTHPLSSLLTLMKPNKVH